VAFYRLLCHFHQKFQREITGQSGFVLATGDTYVDRPHQEAGSKIGQALHTTQRRFL